MSDQQLALEGGSDESVGDLARFGIVTVSDRASTGVYEDLSGPAILRFFHEAIKSKCALPLRRRPPPSPSPTRLAARRRWQAVYRVIPDERPLIEETLKELCDKEGCCLVVTTGGTGPAPRDVTPEATEAVSRATRGRGYSAQPRRLHAHRRRALGRLRARCRVPPPRPRPPPGVRAHDAGVWGADARHQVGLAPQGGQSSEGAGLRQPAAAAEHQEAQPTTACAARAARRRRSLRYVPTAVLSRQTAGLRGKSLILNLPGKPKSIRETIDEVFASIPACVNLLEGPYIETHEAVVKAFRPANMVRRAKPSPAQ